VLNLDIELQMYVYKQLDGRRAMLISGVWKRKEVAV